KQSFIATIHNFCDSQLAHYVGNQSALGLLRAMLLGDEQGFDPELRQAYSQTGIIHIVSISGSHVAMMFLLISAILFWLRGRHADWIKYLIGLTVVWLYVLVAGAPPSAVRSAVMFSIVALSVITAREGQALNTLMAAAFILLVGRPQWLFALGFQLSFLAVLSILLFYQPLVRLWPQNNRLAKHLWQAVCVSFAAEILIAPLVVYYFHNFPVSFVVANLVSSIALGLCTLIGGVAVIALCWIPPVAGFLGELIGILVEGFNKFIIVLQGINPHSFQFLQISVGELLLLYVVIISLAIWLLLKKPKAVLFALPALLMFISSITINKVLAWKSNRLIVYNNGKQASIERIGGGYFLPYISGSDESYYSKAAHTGYYSWRKVGRDSSFNNYFSIAGKNVLILSDSTANQFNGVLPVDILILARPLRQMRVQTAFQAFQPKVIVLAQRVSAYQLRRWHDSCIAHQCRLYNVATGGAFVLE
ncbi:MAG: ComEC/Rec2 family competence protein, partial [Chitinophagaceae bacterium]